MSKHDRPHIERAKYLREHGWHWEYVGTKPKHFLQSEVRLMRPSISIYRR